MHAESCGERCGNNIEPYSNITNFCEKGEKCCVSGPFGEECSTSCGPYDPDGNLFAYWYNNFFSMAYAQTFFSNKISWDEFRSIWFIIVYHFIIPFNRNFEHLLLSYDNLRHQWIFDAFETNLKLIGYDCTKRNILVNRDMTLHSLHCLMRKF